MPLPEITPIQFLLMHTVMTALAAFIATLLLPPQYRSSPRQAFAFHAMLAWFVPILGGLTLIALALYARVINRLHHARPFSEVRLPVFTAAPNAPPPTYGAGSIRPRLLHTELAKQTRIEALLTVQSLPGNLSARLLREVLSDPADDLRLSAYGMLDHGEKQLNLRIQHALDQLEHETLPEARGLLHQRIAESYWELVYQDYAHQGELRAFALQSAWRAAQEALPLRPQDGDLHVLTGRIALTLGYAEEAAAAFARAIELSIPHTRVLPYLAELAFLRRDFVSARARINELGECAKSFSTAPLIAFWNPRGVA